MPLLPGHGTAGTALAGTSTNVPVLAKIPGHGTGGGFLLQIKLSYNNNHSDKDHSPKYIKRIHKRIGDTRAQPSLSAMSETFPPWVGEGGVEL